MRPAPCARTAAPSPSWRVCCVGVRAVRRHGGGDVVVVPRQQRVQQPPDDAPLAPSAPLHRGRRELSGREPALALAAADRPGDAGTGEVQQAVETQHAHEGEGREEEDRAHPPLFEGQLIVRVLEAVAAAPRPGLMGMTEASELVPMLLLLLMMMMMVIIMLLLLLLLLMLL